MTLTLTPIKSRYAMPLYTAQSLDRICMVGRFCFTARVARIHELRLGGPKPVTRIAEQIFLN